MSIFNLMLRRTKGMKAQKEKALSLSKSLSLMIKSIASHQECLLQKDREDIAKEILSYMGPKSRGYLVYLYQQMKGGNNNESFR